MSTMTRFLPRERRTLLADALLFAAAFGGAALALITLVAELVTDTGWYEPASIALMAAAVLVCPWVAWRLHGRRATRATALGATVGALTGGIAVMAVMWSVALVALAVNWLTGDAVSMGVVALVVAGSAVVALLAWLDTDAVRDLVRGHRHVGLDVGRIAATAVALATLAGTLWWAALHPGGEPAEMLAFSLLFGVSAAAVALGADVAAGIAAPAAHTPPAPTPPAPRS